MRHACWGQGLDDPWGQGAKGVLDEPSEGQVVAHFGTLQA